MDRRFAARKKELLEDCQVSPELFKGVMDRLEIFAQAVRVQSSQDSAADLGAGARSRTVCQHRRRRPCHKLTDDSS